MTPYDHLTEAANNMDVPQLEWVPHSQAIKDYAWKLTRNALCTMGFSAHDASVLAGSVSGCARLRMERLVEQKHIVVLVTGGRGVVV